MAFSYFPTFISDFELVAKANSEISLRRLSSKNLTNFSRWIKHIQTFGECCVRDQGKHPK
jgi:hypothetical protein